jgi:hypothetical protein
VAQCVRGDTKNDSSLDVRFVRGQRFQNLLNLTVVRELQSVQRAEATDRHERCSFVPIDKRMVDDDEMEQLERFPVERLEDVVKVTLTDVLAGGSHR